MFAVLNKMKDNDQLNEVLTDIMSTLLNQDTSEDQMQKNQYLCYCLPTLISVQQEENVCQVLDVFWNWLRLKDSNLFAHCMKSIGCLIQECNILIEQKGYKALLSSHSLECIVRTLYQLLNSSVVSHDILPENFKSINVIRERVIRFNINCLSDCLKLQLQFERNSKNEIKRLLE